MNEELSNIIIKIFKFCQLTFDTRHIAKVHRFKPDANTNRTPTIMLSLRRSEDKEILFGKYLTEIAKNNILTVDKIGFTGDSRIYINKQLPSSLNPVHKQAMQQKRLGLIQTVVTKNTFLKICVSGRWCKVQTVNELRQAMKLSKSQSDEVNN